MRRVMDCIYTIKHKLFLLAKKKNYYVVCIVLIQGCGQLHLLGRWLVLLWIGSVMYIVFKKLNGLVVTDREWVLKSACYFYSGVRNSDYWKCRQMLLSNIFPFNTKIYKSELPEIDCSQGSRQHFNREFRQSRVSLSRCLLASRCYHIIGFGQLILIPDTNA